MSPKLSGNGTMKAVAAPTTSSSVKSTTTTASGYGGGEDPDSCYFPGCRKDAHCKCNVCLASHEATLDLRPSSAHRSSLTKFSRSRPVHRSPVSFDPSSFSTPKPNPRRRFPESPVSERLSLEEEVKGGNGKRGFGFGFSFLSLLLGIALVFVAEFGFSWVVPRVLRPELSPNMVRRVGEESSRGGKDLRRRLGILKKGLEGFVDGEMSNCSFGDSRWEVNQDGLLWSWRCVLYKSAAEEVSIWGGWPLQTAGLLTSGFSPRSFTILSGRFTEWSDGKSGYVIRKVNSSWIHRKWSATVVQMDRNTWVLEYQQSSVLKNFRLSAAVEFLKFSMSRLFGRMKVHFWQIPGFVDHRNDVTAATESFKTPT